jgi:hypothetical protein
MQLIEITGGQADNPRQRWANVLALTLAIALFLYGINLRQATLDATVLYSNIQAGISAFYPRNWLLDTRGDYVFRVRDMSRLGFKTTIQISVQPVSADMEARNIADRLALTRARTFTDYTVLAVEPYILGEDTNARAVSYTYVSRETSPFLQGIPDVVVGLDILTLTRGQAIIITYRAEASAYTRELRRFQQFLQTLEF